MKKDWVRLLLVGLLNVAYSQARSGYCPTRRLLPAAFPPWAGSSLLRQPGDIELPQLHHIDAGLSADARSTQNNARQRSRPQAVHQPTPPSSWITGARHNSQPTESHRGFRVMENVVMTVNLLGHLSIM